jgi:hypothetical protein
MQTRSTNHCRCYTAPTASFVKVAEQSSVSTSDLRRRSRDSNSTGAHAHARLPVTCADPRIIPEAFLGFRLPNTSPIGTYFAILLLQNLGWDVSNSRQAYLAIPVIRVIGGRAIHAIENIVGLDAAFGVDTVVLVHHKGTYERSSLSD